MISLTEYLKLNEALVQKKVSSKGMQTLYIPKFKDMGDYTYHFENVEKIEVPAGNFFIYKDKYHKSLHIAALHDMMAAYGNGLSDYEDFGPEDIIAVFDKLKDAVKYALKDGINKYYDSENFCNQVLNGEITDKEILEYDKEFNFYDALTSYLDVDNEDELLKVCKRYKL